MKKKRNDIQIADLFTQNAGSDFFSFKEKFVSQDFKYVSQVLGYVFEDLGYKY